MKKCILQLTVAANIGCGSGAGTTPGENETGKAAAQTAALPTTAIDESSSTGGTGKDTGTNTNTNTGTGKGTSAGTETDASITTGMTMTTPTTSPASECGDGAKDGDEDCDDGNTLSGDGCSWNCKSKPNEWVIFVTKETFYGADLKGISDADELCQKAAEDAKLTGPGNSFTYRAWLSASMQATSLETVIKDIPENIEMVRPDGNAVQTARNLLRVGTKDTRMKEVRLVNTIEITEDGSTVVGDSVWTGSKWDGTPSGNDCDGWTANLWWHYGTVGSVKSTGVEWTSTDSLAPCDTKESRHIYCFRVNNPVP